MPENNHNYLNYTNLTAEDAQMFIDAGLYEDLNVARSKLLNIKKVGFYNKLKNLTNYANLGNKNSEIRKKHLEYINSIIEYSLELIGRYSNQRFGKSASEQDRFFHRPIESDTFFIHLYRAIQAHKQQQIVKANESAAKEMSNSKISEWTKSLRIFEDSEIAYFICNGSRIKEVSLYAAGVFYMTNFLFKDLKYQIANEFIPNRSREITQHFKGGVLYKKIDSMKGGKNTFNKKILEKETAYQIFCSAEYYEKFQTKHGICNDAVAHDLVDDLKEHNIIRSLETLKTHWVPEFIKIYEKDNSLPATK